MATTTPNYLWSVPTSSDLVKNGATAIETLGDSVDASLWNSGYGQAGKNKIINGDFTINQRSFTSTTTSGAYGFDRWLLIGVDGTSTYSAQTFTAGTAPVTGYEATNFARLVTTGQTLSSALSLLAQRIEDVRTFANQTVTFSFWAKAGSGTPKIAIELDQQFGTGGSTRVTTALGQVTISTSWVRYSASITVPSISGKTIGPSNFISANLIVSAGADYNSRTGSLGIQSNTFDIWGVQVEAGSTATPFQTATETIQGELAACQRYYFRYTTTANYGNLAPVAGIASSTTVAKFSFAPPVPMRVNASSLDFSTLILYDTSSTPAITAAAISSESTKDLIGINFTVASGLTQFRPYQVLSSNSTAAYLGASAEL